MRKLFIIFIILLFSSFAFFRYFDSKKIKPTQQIQDELKAEIKQQLKEQILKELNLDIKELVKKEIDGYLAQNTTASFNNTQLSSLSSSSETKDQAMRRIVREITNQHPELKEMSDQELDQYVASSAETEIQTPQGYTKRYAQYQLAQADTTQTETTQQNNETVPAQPKETKKSVTKAIENRGGIIAKKGTFQIENSHTYASFSSNSININGFVLADIFFLGTQEVQSIKRNVFIQNLALRYTPIHNLQAEVRIPGRYQHERKTINNAGGTQSESTSSYGGLGDIEIGLSRQIAWEKGWLPDLLANFGVKTTSGKDPYEDPKGIGTGHWAIRGGLVAVKSSDPAAIFGSINYNYSFERENIKGGFGTIKPGDNIGYSLGTAIALSYKTSISFSYDQNVSMKLKQNGLYKKGTFLNSASFRSGLTWAFNERTSLDFSVAMGLTTDAPDVTVAVRVPYTF